MEHFVILPKHQIYIRYRIVATIWFCHGFSNEIRDIVVYFSIAKEIWDDLAVRFSQKFTNFSTKEGYDCFESIIIGYHNLLY